MPQGSSPELSVVILCYKAGELTRSIVGKMKGHLDGAGVDYEIVLVANYNATEVDTDPTPRIARELAGTDPRIVAITKEKQGMFGWDVKSGLDATKGRYLCFIDGDGQMPVEDVLRLYEIIKKKEVDMAQMFRVKRLDGLERIFISRIYNFLLKTLFPGVRIYDANAKPKMFTRSAYEQLQLESTDWFIDAEIVIQATTLGFRIEQIPTVFLKNTERKSFVKAKDIFQFLVNLVHYRLFGRPVVKRSR